MIDSLKIYRKAHSLSCRFGTSDPETLAESLGITVFSSLNTDLLLGMYVYKWKTRMIFLNGNLEDHVRKCVIAHELGHDQLHRFEAKDGTMQECYSLFKMANRMEYEANAFAAHLILDTQETLDDIHQGATVDEIAQKAGVDINLVLIKATERSKLGYDLRTPQEADGSFLKNLTPEYGTNEPAR